MVINEIRRKNLEWLIYKGGPRAKGQLNEFGARAGEKYILLSQITNQLRNMGDVVARRMEEKLGLERGWFDNVHPETGTRAALADFYAGIRRSYCGQIAQDVAKALGIPASQVIDSLMSSLREQEEDRGTAALHLFDHDVTAEAFFLNAAGLGMSPEDYLGYLRERYQDQQPGTNGRGRENRAPAECNAALPS